MVSLGVALLGVIAARPTLACTAAPLRGTLTEVFEHSQLVVLAQVDSLASGDGAGRDAFSVLRVFRGPQSATVVEITVPAERPLCWVPLFVPDDLGRLVVLALQDPSELSSATTALWRPSASGGVEAAGTEWITGVPSSWAGFLARLDGLGAPERDSDLPPTSTAPTPAAADGAALSWPIALACLCGAGLLASRHRPSRLCRPPGYADPGLTTRPIRAARRA